MKGHSIFNVFNAFNVFNVGDGEREEERWSERSWAEEEHLACRKNNDKSEQNMYNKTRITCQRVHCLPDFSDSSNDVCCNGFSYTHTSCSLLSLRSLPSLI